MVYLYFLYLGALILVIIKTVEGKDIFKSVAVIHKVGEGSDCKWK